MIEGVPAAYQPMVDWVTQPAPSSVGDTHALHFFLINQQGEGPFYVYQGFMFSWRTPTRAISHLITSQESVGSLVTGDT
jgi:hypothetical protein